MLSCPALFVDRSNDLRQLAASIMAKHFKIAAGSKIATLIGLVIAAACAWAILRMVPGAASSLGIRGGHEFTFLRWGSMYTEARPGAWLFGSPRRRSSLIFATRGERILLRSQASIDRGRVVISVHTGTWAGEEIYNDHLISSGSHDGDVLVPATGFYRVSANYVFTFRGRHDLDWRIE